VTGLGLAAWLAVGAALFGLGVLAAVVRHDRGGVLAGLVLMLGAAALSLAALVRHAVLPAAGLATALVLLVIGGAFLLVIEATSTREGEP
jgi:NADH:ubiquinone oxidoreductase subunit K